MLHDGYNKMKKKVLLYLISMFCYSPVVAQNILAIGDSNGAGGHGWVVQLKKIMPEAYIVNTSTPGNTIGFDNNGSERLNTLKNIRNYLSKAQSSVPGDAIHHIVILLGTNDCKAVFEQRWNEVPENLEKLIQDIHTYFEKETGKPTVTVVSPPPYGDDSVLKPKYAGGNKCIQILIPSYKKIAEQYKCNWVNIYSLLYPDFQELSNDGVHLTEEGQAIIAQAIKDAIE